MGKEGKTCTYVCPTCSHTFQAPFQSSPKKCPNQTCASGMFSKMQRVVEKYNPQIRKVLKMTPEEEIDLEDLKKFCAEIFWNDVHLYQDRFTLDATLDRLISISLVDIPYNFN
ncbi:hypothetical protein SS50377_25572 [Spironucleus salmonicida]|uniref:Uncharacterized protein n=1 Tax=Spironucleus salmonicida TaxID=348837 RepID=V6LWD1_9EUKA|nr:hypothetical protein SS50377_25572 [Spironucleus salmonicida]|eukprot:EST45119.1 Hypothetical protein SS50377_15140 [Spironucleus salmonicida]